MLSRFLNSTSRVSTMTTMRRVFSSSQAFPSLTISANELIPRGTFAQAQAEFLQPDPEAVARLDKLLHQNNVGVVAHFYMDPELQGILQAVSWPHVFIADSLAMGNAAVKMVDAGVDAITVLGVDFMTENVQATLRTDGYDTPVYRLAHKHIGCSLAESAEGATYAAYLHKASQTPNSLHVVYINTSLHTKAHAQHIVPTITCTSSNVVQTILQASAQVPDVHIWFGPDTYMGENLQRTFEHMATHLTEAEIAAVHPAHSRATIQAMLKNFDYFKQGNCVVHHMFDESVTQRLRKYHADAHLTAHLEVPGGMFDMSLEAKAQGRGQVGSTADILHYIIDTVQAEVDTPSAAPVRLPFVLGTEAGMITGIVNKVQEVLRTHNSAVEAEIIFPVSSAAITAAPDSELGVVPGVASGEGCSTAGGCATCPFMKMNTLDALFDVVELCGSAKDSHQLTLDLAKFKVLERASKMASAEVDSAQLGVVPINHMRAFQDTKQLPDELVHDIAARASHLAASAALAADPEVLSRV